MKSSFAAPSATAGAPYPDNSAPADELPMQLMLFETAADSIVETSDARTLPGERRVAAAEEPRAAGLRSAPWPQPVELTGDDGVVKFRLVSSAGGLVVNRTHRSAPARIRRQPPGGRVDVKGRRTDACWLSCTICGTKRS